MKNSLFGFISLVIAALIFAADGTFVSSLNSSFNNFDIPVIRFGVALIIVSVYLIARRVSLKIENSNRKTLLIFSISYTLAFSSLIAGILNSTNVNNAIFLMLAGALITTVILGKFMFNEDLDKYKITALVVTVIGMGFIAFPFNFDFGLIISLISGVFFGIANSLRRSLGSVNYFLIIFYQSLFAVVISLVVVVILGDSGLSLDSFSEPLNLVLALLYGVTTVATGLLVTYGFNNFPVNLSQLVLTAELPFAIVLNFIFIQVVPTTQGIIGGALIFLSFIIISELFKVKFERIINKNE